MAFEVEFSKRLDLFGAEIFAALNDKKVAKTTISLEIIKDIIKIGQKISCAIRKIYGNSLGIPSNKMQEKTK